MDGGAEGVGRGGRMGWMGGVGIGVLGCFLWFQKMKSQRKLTSPRFITRCSRRGIDANRLIGFYRTLRDSGRVHIVYLYKNYVGKFETFCLYQCML